MATITININNKNRTIELSKKDYAAAQKYDSDAYIDLQAVRKDYPTYRVVPVSRGKSHDSYKGLNYNYMENYIIEHDMKDNPESKMLENFYTLCGKDAEGNDLEFAAIASFGEVRKWFLDNHPELKITKNAINEILKPCRETRKAA